MVNDTIFKAVHWNIANFQLLRRWSLFIANVGWLTDVTEVEWRSQTKTIFSSCTTTGHHEKALGILIQKENDIRTPTNSILLAVRIPSIIQYPHRFLLRTLMSEYMWFYRASKTDSIQKVGNDIIRILVVAQPSQEIMMICAQKADGAWGHRRAGDRFLLLNLIIIGLCILKQYWICNVSKYLMILISESDTFSGKSCTFEYDFRIFFKQIFLQKNICLQAFKLPWAYFTPKVSIYQYC